MDKPITGRLKLSGTLVYKLYHGRTPEQLALMLEGLVQGVVSRYEVTPSSVRNIKIQVRP